MNSQQKATRLIRTLWSVWLCLVALLLLVRFVGLRGTNEDTRFGLFVAYALLSWLSCMALNLIESQKIMTYLRKYHNQKWQVLTYVPGFGSGGQNGFRSLPFLLSQDDLGDEKVKQLKDEYKNFLKFMLTVFVTFPILFIMVMI